MKVHFILCFVFLLQVFHTTAQVRFVTSQGSIHFKSDAPLELIEANSEALRGIIDIEQNAFAFSVDMHSFQGFNSPLQKEHFNENYLETKKYAKATFSGKIIESIDWTTNGTYEVRTKGKLHIHGIEQERIIKASITIVDGKLSLKSAFTVLLNEHQITIPKIMFQKIAEEIAVTIEADLEKQSS